MNVFKLKTFMSNWWPWYKRVLFFVLPKGKLAAFCPQLVMGLFGIPFSDHQQKL